MSGRLEQQQLDFGARFQESLHENGFIGQSKEILWQVSCSASKTHIA